MESDEDVSEEEDSDEGGEAPLKQGSWALWTNALAPPPEYVAGLASTKLSVLNKSNRFLCTLH